MKKQTAIWEIFFSQLSSTKGTGVELHTNLKKIDFIIIIICMCIDMLLCTCPLRQLTYKDDNRSENK